MSPQDWSAIALTLRLAGISTLLLLALCIPCAWWLAHSRSRLRPFMEAGAMLPLVLPPTVLGFYLLLAFGPHGPVGKLTSSLGLSGLAFTFPGVVLASILYSLPFVLQPLLASFRAVRQEELESALLLGAGRWQRMRHVILPSCRSGLLSAACLGFAHTVGEFGVVLMIGGNIDGETRVISIALYNQVEQANYGAAHQLALMLLLFSLAALSAVYWLNARQKQSE
ncbi:molybdate ABC transporter permease subunit [Chromobacterium vaccinii]|uniref:Molybdenum transport system permease n=1 Tax=Chromobacterium vaccinii TaxID=1108595 RepID=A0A1D9LG93_9NEIS|nr:molybdate ABC transporter permease subunit [Chromobacterium vaccinii]AOZ50204.1 molybdenum ABC transporter permease subunit [Chromobacterium vaccinii]SUX54858.1 Sulfate transport system permease protein CysW [Chromobacterium vaccinii]